MFQESEIINLGLAAFSLVFIFPVFINKGLDERSRYFYLGLFCIVGALFFTVIEGVLWGDFFNLLEHMCFAIAGIFFVAGVLRIRRSTDNTLESDQ